MRNIEEHINGPKKSDKVKESKQKQEKVNDL